MEHPPQVLAHRRVVTSPQGHAAASATGTPGEAERSRAHETRCMAGVAHRPTLDSRLPAEMSVDIDLEKLDSTVCAQLSNHGEACNQHTRPHEHAVVRSTEN